MAKPINPDETHAFDLFDDAPKQFVLDRSTLELWQNCPFQAWCIETGKVKITNTLMAAGNEIHAGISRCIQEWIDTDGMLEEFGGRVKGAIVDYLEGELRASRPDVQPQVLAGARASLWSFAEFLSQIRPVNILAFDGGEGDLSSQFAVDLPGLNVRATSELDLLTATESIDVLRITDWKTGWKHNTAAIVRESFQFQMHADLVFERYPGIQAVEVVAWDTRSNRRTYRVLFDRKHKGDFHTRILMAVEARMRYYDNPPAWPTVEKCSTCPAACLCPEADKTTKNHTTDPPAVLEQLIATEARAKALKAFLTKTVDTTGQPVLCGTHAFGRVRKTKKEPNAQIYKLKPFDAKPEAESEESTEPAALGDIYAH